MKAIIALRVFVVFGILFSIEAKSADAPSVEKSEIGVTSWQVFDAVASESYGARLLSRLKESRSTSMEERRAVLQGIAEEIGAFGELMDRTLKPGAPIVMPEPVPDGLPVFSGMSPDRIKDPQARRRYEQALDKAYESKLRQNNYIHNVGHYKNIVFRFRARLVGLLNDNLISESDAEQLLEHAKKGRYAPSVDFRW